MDRDSEFRRRCERFAAYRRRFLLILIGICALFTAVADLAEYLSTGKVVSSLRRAPPCPPVYNQERHIEQLNTVELVC